MSGALKTTGERRRGAAPFSWARAAPSGGSTQLAPVSSLQNGGLSWAPCTSIAGRSVSNAICEYLRPAVSGLVNRTGVG